MSGVALNFSRCGYIQINSSCPRPSSVRLDLSHIPVSFSNNHRCHTTITRDISLLDRLLPLPLPLPLGLAASRIRRPAPVLAQYIAKPTSVRTTNMTMTMMKMTMFPGRPILNLCLCVLGVLGKVVVRVCRGRVLRSWVRCGRPRQGTRRRT